MTDLATIFILDDDLEFGELLSEVITQTGKHVEVEQSASNFLSSKRPSAGVLILDLIMPEMDGIEVIRALAENNERFSLILISGFDERVLHSARQLAEAHNIKVLGSFTKPIKITEFRQLILSLEEPAEQVPSSVVKSKKYTAAELSHAIQAGQLILYYQPQIELGSNKLVALEALVRWQNEDHGLVFPDDFIPLAEETGLITELTQAVMTAACRDLADHKEALEGIAISINISSKNVVSLGFPEQLLALSSEFGVDPTQINLELTETAVMGELTSYLDILNRLRMKGFSLSIDDFGTGYSSLSKLYQAPFTELKIDSHFVIRMMRDNEAMAIVEICIMLGRMLGMKVVAEGAENQLILDQLTSMGCDIAQGYGIARPAPLADIIAWKNTLA